MPAALTDAPLTSLIEEAVAGDDTDRYWSVGYEAHGKGFSAADAVRIADAFLGCDPWQEACVRGGWDDAAANERAARKGAAVAGASGDNPF